MVEHLELDEALSLTWEVSRMRLKACAIAAIIMLPASAGAAEDFPPAELNPIIRDYLQRQKDRVLLLDRRLNDLELNNGGVSCDGYNTETISPLKSGKNLCL